MIIEKKNEVHFSFKPELSEKNSLHHTKKSQATKWNYEACGYKVTQQNV